jgi:formylglycine-generating enzyme required for sulfatase activity
MDYIEGQSLGALLKQRGKPFDEADVRNFLDQVLDSLAETHRHSIWHLDIKPGNLMMNADGKLLLIDFGASKLVDASGDYSTSTMIAYTRGYAPIEQIEQRLDAIGAHTDFYALGATLYNLITGLTPPERSMIDDYGDDAFQYPAATSPAMRRLIRYLMQPLRRNRPQNIKKLRQFIAANHLGPVAPADIAEPEADPIADVILVATTPPPEPQPVLQPSQHSVNETGDHIFRVNGVAFTMVAVKGCTFMMGATQEQGKNAFNDEKPVHQVTLSDYFIGQTQATQQLWRAVMGNNPSKFTGDLQRPVEQVSWNDCQRFISKLNALTGFNFRLPTEAEWELAACGGMKSQGYKYSGSDDLDDVAWYSENRGKVTFFSDKRSTHPVGSKGPNELGLYDMSGNVWEWCQDWYGDYSEDAQTNPTGPASGSSRVSRGGSWDHDAGFCRVSSRGCSTPSYTYCNLGFRLAL